MHKHFKTYIFIILVFSTTTGLFAQNKLNFKAVNDKTYSLFLEKNWDQLIELGTTSLNQGLDFYYLYYRLGIAYFHKKNYIKAIEHFDNALVFNDSDPYLLEYKYYSFG